MLAVASWLRCQIAGQGLSAWWGIGRAGIKRGGATGNSMSQLRSSVMRWQNQRRSQFTGSRVAVFWNVPWVASLEQAQGTIQEPVGRTQLVVLPWELSVYRSRCTGGRNVTPREQWRVGRAVAQSKALQTEGGEEAGKAGDSGRHPGTRVSLLPHSAKRLFIIKWIYFSSRAEKYPVGWARGSH